MASEAYFNGKFIATADLAVPFHDAGFVMGATVSEMVRTFHRKPFRMDDHLARFRRSCEICRVPLRQSDDELKSIAVHLIEQNSRELPSLGDLALVLFATPGPIGYYAGLPGGPGEGPSTLGIHTFPLLLQR